MQARIVKVEALYSMPDDTAVAACARAAKATNVLSASATVQLRVVPGPLATVAVTPGGGHHAEAPAGFFTFARGTARDGATHVILQARDACGNALTRDVIDDLPVRSLPARSDEPQRCSLPGDGGVGSGSGLVHARTTTPEVPRLCRAVLQCHRCVPESRISRGP